MNNELQPSNNIITLKDWMRPLLGIFSGVLGGFLMFASMDSGANLFFEESDVANSLFNDFEYSYLSDILIWGDHWIFRTIGSFACTLWGGFLGGLISRRKGKIIGLISSIPTSIIWLAYYIISFSGDIVIGDYYFEVYTTLPLKIMAFVLTIGSLIVGYIGGETGEDFSYEFSEYFDKRKFSLLGIKWYHYLWLPLPLHFIILQSIWVILYSSDFLILSWTNIYSIIPMIFLIPLYYSLYLTVTGLSKGYIILSGIDNIPQLKNRILGVLKFGCGFPLLAMLIQSAVGLIGYGISKLFG